MRKAMSLLLIFVLVLGLAPMPFLDGVLTVSASTGDVIASGTCGDSITWTLTEESEDDWDLSGTPYKLTLSGSGKMETYSSYSSVPWYEYRASIVSLSIAEGITAIGNYAFYECVSLTAVTLPDSVTSIGSNAFQYDYLLETVVCGSGLTTIGNRAFFCDSTLSELQLNDGLETIGSYAFYYTISLKSVTLPDSVKSIGSYAFSDSKITSITIPENVSSIGVGVFYYCYYLENIEVAEGNSYYAVIDYVLYELSDGTPYKALAYPVGSDNTELNVAEGTEIVASFAFAFATHILSISLPSTLKTLQQSSLTRSQITELSIPDSVETIESFAFQANYYLTEVTIGAGLTSFSEGIFNGCTSIDTIAVDEENPYLCSADNVVYSKDSTVLYYYAPAREGTVFAIPETVETIAQYGISQTSLLEELYVPESVTEIAFYGLYKNTNLRSVYFYGDAPTVSNSSYSIYGSASNLILYRTEASAGWDDSAWSSFTIADWDPDNDIEVEGTLGDITWLYEGDIGRITFTGSGAVPDFTEDDPAPWSEYMDAIQTIEGNDVTGIGDYAFSNAAALLRMKTEDSLLSVGSYAFADCEKLFYVEISAVETVGSYAFYNDSALADALSLEKAASIGEGAFSGCTSITSVTLGSCLTVLEAEAFSGCTALGSFLVPESVTAMEEGALKNCTSLRTVNIPAAVETIEALAFYGDTALEKVYFYGAVPADWADDSFSGCSDSLTLYYRAAQTDWESLNGYWNSLPLVGLSRFYTEQEDHYSFSNTASSFGYSSGYRIPRQRYVDVLDDIITGTYYYAITKKMDRILLWHGEHNAGIL